VGNTNNALNGLCLTPVKCLTNLFKTMRKITAADRPLKGLFLMIIMTSIWAVVADASMGTAYYHLPLILFGFVVLYFVIRYVRLHKEKENLPALSQPAETGPGKNFWMIFAAEGVAIFVAKNVLVNIGRNELFICCMALIVGLHFIPLAIVFKRQFDFYIAAWTSICAVAGLALISSHAINTDLVNMWVAIACAIATALQGLRMINEAQQTLIAG
jgi:hypothetical protein